MSRDASVSLDWGDDHHTFRLGWGQLIALQEAVDAGPFVVLDRLQNGSWKVQDISHVIRLGLIGGGMKTPDAVKLVKTYVEAYPPAENLLFAQVILSAGVIGAPDEDAVKKNGSPTESASTLSPTESSESPTSTAPGLQ